MRFKPWPRPTSYVETSRKRAAFLARQRRECEALPLFADMIAAEQHGVDEEMARRADWWPCRQQQIRDQRAMVWRQARARLFEFPDETRTVIRHIWRTCPYPADPSYFADLLHQIRIGKIDPNRPPWKYHARLEPRTTPNPQCFADAFRRIGQRQVELEPGTAPVEARLFCGNLGNGILFLDTLPPAATDGVVTIHVRGVCTGADLTLIGRLAEAAQQRAVKVVRSETPGRQGERPTASP
jgi:hypothetical protein